MNDEHFFNVMRDVERHEDALREDVREIKSLKDDLRELVNLMGLLGLFVPKPVSGMAEEKAAIEFANRLRALLEKHGIES